MTAVSYCVRRNEGAYGNTRGSNTQLKAQTKGWSDSGRGLFSQIFGADQKHSLSIRSTANEFMKYWNTQRFYEEFWNVVQKSRWEVERSDTFAISASLIVKVLTPTCTLHNKSLLKKSSPHSAHYLAGQRSYYEVCAKFWSSSLNHARSLVRPA